MSLGVDNDTVLDFDEISYEELDVVEVQKCLLCLFDVYFYHVLCSHYVVRK